MIIVAVFLGIALCIDSVALQLEGRNGMPRNFAECMENDVLIAEIKNMTHLEVQVFCKDLLVAQIEERAVEMKNPNITSYIKHLLRGIVSEMTGDKHVRNKRNIFGGGSVFRREMREPPYDRTWGCFVRGVQRLKNDYSVSRTMNTYDVICSLHSGRSVPVAHNGPGFFGWHRAFIRIMEFAIGCPIPYWDTTIDYAMDDPTQSITWSPKYFGNGYGMVTTGPFARLPGRIPIIRNINAAGWLMSNRDIDLVLSKTNFVEFTEPSPCDSGNRGLYSFECMHDGTHVWIDGTVAVTDTAPLDPMFFPFHVFVDKIFKEFKRKLGRNSVYPDNSVPGHGPNDRMVFYDVYPGIEPLTHSQAYGDALDSLIDFSQKPQCPMCSGSSDLYCERERNICLPRKREGMDAMARAQMAIRTSIGTHMMAVMEPDMPVRADRLIQRFGPLPFPGPKFRAAMRDSRTMGKSMPFMTDSN